MLNIVILLQLLGLVCGFFQYKYLDNLINLSAVGTGIIYTIIAIIKYLSWGLGFLAGAFAIIHSKYFVRDKADEYRTYTKEYIELLKSKTMQALKKTLEKKAGTD